ncbi:uncharacterized protein LOC113309338 [Papaver somniferum]|uniref:uncharacterized protein LOC113309338 n=1 Tax=Papaver somniferum TaxID=3469 RepID=UPI000E6F8E81|nr:uncharacterized protein LOC113309338 [Papaver somniferum]
MAAITRKRSAGFFSSFSVVALVVCIVVHADMVSAWENICKPGDIYMDSQTTAVSDPHCNTCTNWCISQCTNLNLSMVSGTNLCSISKPSTLNCKCCCGASPSSPEKPTLPPSASEFNGPPPYDFKICVGNQTYQKFQHHDGKHCIDTPLCEQKCKEKGLTRARSECVAAGHNTTTALTWYEQCCCQKPVPSPPPPTPPTSICEADCPFVKRLGCALFFKSCSCCCKSILLPCHD